MKKKMYQRPDGLFEKALTIDGKKHHFYGKTEREVFLKISQYKKIVADGKTMEEVTDAWLGSIENDISPSTYEGYKATTNKIIRFFKGKYIRAITRDDCFEFMDSLPQLTRGGTVSKKTATNSLAILNQIFEFAIDRRYLEENPRRNVHVQKNLKKTSRQAISEEQIRKIVTAAKEDPKDLRSILALFALYTGLRRGELICLQYSDIDFDRKTIKVSKAIYYNSNTAEIKTPKTAAGYRDVVLPDVLSDLLPHKNSADFIFSQDGGKSMLSKSQLRDAWAMYQIKNDLVGVTLHMLRHTYASLLYDAGIDVKMAQSLLGHSDISTTQNIYTHILKTKQERDFAALNNYFNDIADK